MDRYDIFRRDVPPEYIHDCLLGLFENYLSAAELCGDRFEPSEAFNVLPFYRRGMIEATLRDVAAGYPGMQSTVERNGFWNHTVVAVGDCIITQATVQDPFEMVRHSLARQCYCEPDNQRYLDSSFAPATASRSGFVFGLLVHGREPRERFFPAFAHIVFPNRNLNGYFSRRIDLFREFPEVVRQCTSGIFEERHQSLEQQFGQIEMPEPELREDLGESFA
jgi:hypothetical protein